MRARQPLKEVWKEREEQRAGHAARRGAVADGRGATHSSCPPRHPRCSRCGARRRVRRIRGAELRQRLQHCRRVVLPDNGDALGSLRGAQLVVRDLRRCGDRAATVRRLTRQPAAVQRRGVLGQMLRVREQCVQCPVDHGHSRAHTASNCRRVGRHRRVICRAQLIPRHTLARSAQH